MKRTDFLFSNRTVLIPGFVMFFFLVFVPIMQGTEELKTESTRANSEDERDRIDLLKQLNALGYLAGYTPADDNKNVTVYNKKLSYEGYNFYVSGHNTEIVMIDMEGKELHKWAVDVLKQWPDIDMTKWDCQRDGLTRTNTFSFRKAVLLENGDLLALISNIGLIKLDSDSRVLWDYRAYVHHDLDVDDSGNVYIITHEYIPDSPYNNGSPIFEDFIVVLDRNGHEIKKISILKALENSVFAPILHRMPKQEDPLHTNTIKILKTRLSEEVPFLKKGNVLVCILFLDMIGIIDMENERFVWTMSGLWRRPHEPSLLENGNMMIFDNQGITGKSRILEFHPLTKQVIWTYVGPPEKPFFSASCGTCQKLPNGNVLITESIKSRVFEVTRDGEIVWEFYNPHRVQFEKDPVEKKATLFDMVRINTDFTKSWFISPQ